MTQIEVPNDGPQSEIKQIKQSLPNHLIPKNPTTKRLHGKTDRGRLTNGITLLNLTLLRKARGHHIFRGITGHIGSHAINS